MTGAAAAAGEAVPPGAAKAAPPDAVVAAPPGSAEPIPPGTAESVPPGAAAAPPADAAPAPATVEVVAVEGAALAADQVVVTVAGQVATPEAEPATAVEPTGPDPARAAGADGPAGDATAPPLPGAGPRAAVSVTESVAMASQRPRLRLLATPAGPDARLTERTGTSDLLTLARRARGRELAGAARPGPLAGLDALVNALVALRSRPRAAVTDRSEADVQAELRAAVPTITRLLRQLGEEFRLTGLTDLGHRSRHVLGSGLAPDVRHRATGVLYPTEYDAATVRWFHRRVEALHVFGDPTRFRDEVTGREHPRADAALRPRPSLAEHWDAVGRFTTQRDRDAFVNDATGSARGSAGLVVVADRADPGPTVPTGAAPVLAPEVGPDFRGPLDES
ncbi:MAG: hypothetical protein ACFCVF_04320 [Kineosporiaceae bacterium]